MSALTTRLPLLLAALFLLPLAGCDSDDPDDDIQLDTIVGLASDDPNLETLVQALQAAGLVQTLQGDGPFTVFAPTDAAFAALSDGTLDALLADGNEAILTDLLTYHVVSGALTSGELDDGQTLTTLEGGTLEVNVDGGTVTINGVPVTTANVRADNGVVHLVGGVLTQGLDVVQRAAVEPELSTLVAAVQAAGLAGTLGGDGPFTVFAPVDGAFDALPAGALETLLEDGNQALLQKVLTYHVVPGTITSDELQDGQTVGTVEGSDLTIDLDGGATVNGIDIVATDIAVDNGVVHLIDGVLTENLDLVDVAVLRGFETLVTAVDVAGLTETLREGGPFTVFAPTDAAFEALPDGVLQDLLDDPAQLADVLLYHVTDGRVLSTDLMDGMTVPTLLDGATLEIQLGSGVVVNPDDESATVVAADVPAANGVIHAIDAVLVPDE